MANSAAAVDDWVNAPAAATTHPASTAKATDDDWADVDAQAPAGRRFGSGVWNQTLGAVVPTIKRALGMDDLDQADQLLNQGHYTEAGEKILSWAQEGPAGRFAKDLLGTSADQIQKTGQALKDGRYSDAIAHAGAATVPILAPSANAIEKMESGDMAGGLGDVTGNAISLVAPKVIPAVARGAAEIPDAVRSAASSPGGSLAEDVTGMMAPRLMHGIKAAGKAISIAQRLLDSMRTAPAEESTPPVRPATPEAAAPSEPPPYFSGGSTIGRFAPPAIPGRAAAPFDTSSPIDTSAVPVNSAPEPASEPIDRSNPVNTRGLMITEQAPEALAYDSKAATARQIDQAEQLAGAVHRAGISADEIGSEPEHWELAAKSIGIGPPSKFAIAQALFKLHRMEAPSSVSPAMLNRLQETGALPIAEQLRDTLSGQQ